MSESHYFTQVCEEYKLHRETFYLSVDMYDRFMDTHTRVQKEELQLIGITCLFIASKIEVSYKSHFRFLFEFVMVQSMV